MSRLLFWLLLGLLNLQASAGERPNILLLIGDNWSWPHAGALGDPLARTPAFDRIAKEGTLFRHAFCPVPSCSPTRSCILTGRAAHQLEDAASLWSAFPKKLEVFTGQLAANGYETGFTGKGWSPGRYKEYGWPHNPVGPEHEDFDAFLNQRNAAKPFFFWLGNVDTALHRWRDRQSGWSAEEIAKVKVPPVMPDTPEVRGSLLAYYSGVAAMDAVFAQAIASLERAGMLDRTVIVCTSDNGWQLPRGLANCHDSGTRVPFAVRWPGHAAAGRVVGDFISLTDLAPTFLELAGLKPPPVMTGGSFVDVLEGRPSSTPRDHVFLERERHANVRSGNLSYPVRGIRTRDHLFLWNLRPDRWPAGDPKVWFAVGDFGDVDDSVPKSFILGHRDEPDIRPFFDLSFGKRPEFELYDLGNDPHQLSNVAGRPDYAGIRSQLLEKVKAWMKDTTDPRVDPTTNVWDSYPYFGGRAKEPRPVKKRP